MSFDGTITLGTICVIVTIIATAWVGYTKATVWLTKEFTGFRSTLDQHTGQLVSHALRMDRYEERYILIANQLQRIIGRMEGDRRLGKRESNHDGESEP